MHNISVTVLGCLFERDRDSLQEVFFKEDDDETEQERSSSRVS